MTKFDETCSEISRRHQLQADYEKTIALLHALKAGEVALDQVTMTPDGGWNFNAAPPLVAPPSLAAVPEAIKERLAGNGTIKTCTESDSDAGSDAGNQE
jgi:hypothetical protein